MEDTTRKKRILIAMIEVGGCHAAIAHAIKDALEKDQPGVFDIEVVDLPRASGAIQVDRFIKRFWRMALARPVLTTQVNAWMDEVGHLAHSNTLVRVFFQNFVRKGMRLVLAYEPDLVICTHFFCTSVAAFARQQSNGSFGVVAHVSDPFHAHGLWVNLLADELVVCSDTVRAQLLALGQPEERMTVLPFPIHSRFFLPVTASREDLLDALGLDPSRLTILASFGGEGIGDMTRYLRYIYLSELPVNLIVACGKNEGLLRELRLLALRPSSVRMAPLGFVHNMNELAEAADVGLVKAGPSTLFELLAKGCPVMVTQVAAKVEEGNLRFVTEQGLGWDVREMAAFQEVLGKLGKPGFLQAVRDRIRLNPYLSELPGAASRVAARMAGFIPDNTTR